MIHRLETKESRDKKTRNRNIFFGIIIAIVMVAGTVGWAISSGEKESIEKYNGFVFSKGTDNYWHDQSIGLKTTFLPKEVENITSEGILNIEKFAGKTLYLSVSTIEEKQAALEIATNLQSFANRIQFACPEDINDSFCADQPIKNCNDTSLDSAIIVVSEGNLTKSVYTSGCLTITGDGEDLIKVADKATFLIFGVIK
jgi:hypothetical protein